MQSTFNFTGHRAHTSGPCADNNTPSVRSLTVKDSTVPTVRSGDFLNSLKPSNGRVDHQKAHEERTGQWKY